MVSSIQTQQHTHTHTCKPVVLVFGVVSVAQAVAVCGESYAFAVFMGGGNTWDCNPSKLLPLRVQDVVSQGNKLEKQHKNLKDMMAMLKSIEGEIKGGEE